MSAVSVLCRVGLLMGQSALPFDPTGMTCKQSTVNCVQGLVTIGPARLLLPQWLLRAAIVNSHSNAAR